MPEYNHNVVNKFQLGKLQKIKTWLGSGSINIFGLPFAGKDTHGKELTELFDGHLIGGGEIIRSSSTPQHMKDHIAGGVLTPTDEYLELMLPYFNQPKFKGKPLILSSVGRWFGEQLPVSHAAKDSGHEIKAVLFLDITRNEQLKRWKTSLHLQDRGKRHDDAEHILETRNQEFETKTLPVINYYKQQGLLLEINSNGTKHETLNLIIEKLLEHATRTRL
jgi:adenylate kinase